MPFQVQSDIDGNGVYEPVIQVPADGEVITSAALADTAVALGRRVEYVNDRVDELTVDPFTVSEIKDDFSHVFASGSIVYSDSGVWQVANAGTFRGVTSLTPVDASHPGIIEWINDQGNAVLYKQPNSVTIDSLEKMIIHVWLDPDNSGFEFGLSQGSATAVNTTGVEAFTAQWDSGQGSNWLLRTGQVGGNTRLDTGSAITFSAWNRIELMRESAGVLKMRINGGSYSTAVGTLPNEATALTPIIRFGGSSSSDPCYVDAVSWRFLTPGRGV